MGKIDKIITRSIFWNKNQRVTSLFILFKGIVSEALRFSITTLALPYPFFLVDPRRPTQRSLLLGQLPEFTCHFPIQGALI